MGITISIGDPATTDWVQVGATVLAILAGFAYVAFAEHRNRSLTKEDQTAVRRYIAHIGADLLRDMTIARKLFTHAYETDGFARAKFERQMGELVAEELLQLRLADCGDGEFLVATRKLALHAKGFHGVCAAIVRAGPPILDDAISDLDRMHAAAENAQQTLDRLRL